MSHMNESCLIYLIRVFDSNDSEANGDRSQICIQVRCFTGKGSSRQQLLQPYYKDTQQGVFVW